MLDRLAAVTSLFARQREHIPLWHSYDAALNWLIAHRLEGGIAVTNRNIAPYPEVTGYIVPTLWEAGEVELAIDLARWLVSIQEPDGGFLGTDGAPYLFDTGQVMRGLLTVIEALPDAEPALRRAADWMLANSDEQGIVRPSPESAWSRRFGHRISENIHLYALPPLLEAGRVLNDSRYVDAVERSMAYYVGKPEIVTFQFLTHFYGYVLEALVDLGRADLAMTGIEPVVKSQRRDGSIPAVPEAGWMCSPGSAQMAVVGYKLGLTTFANSIVDHLQLMQTPSGGFLGSYGPGADYAPDEEPSWACKYFLDACHWRIRTTFAEQRDRFPAETNESDPRLLPVLQSIGDVADKRVLDVGCGKGPFLREVQLRYPAAELWGVDISSEVLQYVPAGVATKQASMLNLPFSDGSFDAVLCIEALEHAVRINRALSELCRVLKPGGRLVIVDKDIRHLGALKIEKWEKWFDPATIAAMLGPYCLDVSYRSLSTSPESAGGTPLVIWQATRGADGLTSEKVVSPSVSAANASNRVLQSYHGALRSSEATRLVQLGFSRYDEGDLSGARLAFISALRWDARWLGNAGVRSIIVRSLLHGRRHHGSSPGSASGPDRIKRAS